MKHKGIRRIIKLEADAGGNAPTSIHLISVGQWRAPWHGNFEMTPDDLIEMVQHFEAGEASVEGSKKLPINYGHDISGKAAGWITRLWIDESGNQLWGDVEWTPEGTRMLKEGEFRYISPEWNPRSVPYQDPEDEERWLNNVFTGAGLTNIPLFKKLKPVMASLVTGSSDNQSNKEGGSMALNLDEVRTKKPEELSDEEKTFLEEHKAELTDDERKTFGLEVEQAETEAEESEEQSEDAAEGETEAEKAEEEEKEGAGVQASANVQGISASELAQLRADAKAGREAQRELLETKLRASVTNHVERGAIKSDQVDSTVEMLMASSEDTRKAQLKFMDNLPSNQLVASEVGKSVTETEVKLTDEEVSFAEAFGNSKEELEEYKKSQKED